MMRKVILSIAVVTSMFLFDWTQYSVVVGMGLTAWLYTPLLTTEYIINIYEQENAKPLTRIPTFSAWILAFAWFILVISSLYISYAINVMVLSRAHYVALYILSPAFSLFLALVGGFCGLLVSHFQAKSY
ncbi:hypothetical protein PTW35_25940 (plasmid) [Photobacterium sp. DA100]|uniref:hypothetical protein n=1 Tax=Photobacterium sp. DA100 TaxID=3027472 RepID=UPI00247AFF0E|nr:hypothetical protein [Photobacterium sp. DA100]WEM44699.1 hypothetical protein PTW35_25940 [Photobacterium sp. DA100]